MRTPGIASPVLLLALAGCSERPEPIVTNLYATTPALGRTALGAPLAPPSLDVIVTHLEAAAPDSTVRLGTRIVSRDFARGDTVFYRYFRGDTLLLSRRRVQLADTSQAPAPPYGQAATYKGCAVIERGGRASGTKSGSMCWTWAYTRPPLPPTLDSVIRIVRLVLLPPNGEVAARVPGIPVLPENQLQLCPFAVLSDGRKVKLRNAWNVPGCDAAYKIWLAAG
ncbi:MAG: hypothetical protein ACREMZ_15075 [Gemmatimonadales bacterium]